jgi:hypothetical protein
VSVVQHGRELVVTNTAAEGPPPYLRQFDRYVVLVNDAACEHAATVADTVAPSAPNRPATVTLQAADGRTVDAQVWPSVLSDAGLRDPAALRSKKAFLYVYGSHDPYSASTVATIEAVALAPPDPDEHVRFDRSRALKAYFNDTLHDAKEAGAYKLTDQILVNHGRAVPVRIHRCGVANSILLDKVATCGMVKEHASFHVPDPALKDVVEAASREEVVVAVSMLEQPSGMFDFASAQTLQGAFDKITGCDKELDAKTSILAVFLHMLLNCDKEHLSKLRPLVFGCDGSTPVDSGDDSSDDDSGDDESGGVLQSLF